jgi:EmrB/QacA subfamily drug resistance transporter
MNSNTYKWIVLVTVSIVTFSTALDMSILIVSFPRLVDLFNIDTATVVWLVIAFSIAELGLLLTVAKIGDSVGRKKVFLLGLILYTLGLIFCSISQGISHLILSRIVQGAGAAMTVTIGSAIVVAVFPDEQRGRALGILGMSMSGGLIAGPALGGIILDTLDWQGIFYTRIPIGILCLFLSIAIIKEQKESEAPLKLDLGGAVTLLAGTSCLLLYLNLGKNIGYISVKGLILALAAVVFIVLFFYFEIRVPQPVLDLSFFKNRIFSMANATNIIQMTAGVAGPTLLPFFLIDGLSYSPTTVGILMALIAVPPVIVGPVSGWFSDKAGPRLPMVTAMCIMTVSLFLASRLNIDSGVFNIGAVLLMFGVSMGLFMAPNQSAIVGAVLRKNLATAMGVANTMRLLGASIGTAAVGTLFASQQIIQKSRLYEQGIEQIMINRLAVVNSFQFVLLLAAILCFIAVITSLFTGGDLRTSKSE